MAHHTYRACGPADGGYSIPTLGAPTTTGKTFRLARIVAIAILGAALILATGCDRRPKAATQPSAANPAPAKSLELQSLADARKGFKTHLTKRIVDGTPAPRPPGELFRVVRYEAPVGKLAAYLTPDPGDGARHAAIVWITGGDCNSIGDVWTEARPENDQTAAAYRRAGIVMMFPSLRGGNDNPGQEEKFLGEVDDVLAAADFLTAQAYVDPQRIYLGGHSSGGTLALLVSECSARFRDVFCFGPTDSVAGYAKTMDMPFDTSDGAEIKLRAPAMWLQSIQSPTFIFEGERMPSDIHSLRLIEQRAAKLPQVHVLAAPGANHFSILSPLNRLIADRIVYDTGEKTNIRFVPADLSKLIDSPNQRMMHVTLTPAAAAAVRSLATASGVKSPWHLVIGQGTMDMEEGQIDPQKYVGFDSNGIHVAVVINAEPSLRGIVVDYVGQLPSGGFKFEDTSDPATTQPGE